MIHIARQNQKKALALLNQTNSIIDELIANSPKDDITKDEKSVTVIKEAVNEDEKIKIIASNSEAFKYISTIRDQFNQSIGASNANKLE